MLQSLRTRIQMHIMKIQSQDTKVTIINSKLFRLEKIIAIVCMG